ncbi:putative pyridoxine 5'-phosphate oxidase superfamily flavin-nucleotide-binding protein [Bradyrhizobium diazoefficiens]
MLDALTYLTSAEELRPPYLPPSALMRAKQLDRLDPHCCKFIAHAPFVIIGSSHPERGHDVRAGPANSDSSLSGFSA